MFGENTFYVSFFFSWIMIPFSEDEMTKSRFKIWVFLLHCIFFSGELIIHYDFLKSDPKLVHSVKLNFFLF